MSKLADAAVVFADFPAVRKPPGGPIEIPISSDDALGNEWAVVVDAPGYAACLLAWEQPGDTAPGDPNDLRRRFEAIWTIDPLATRRAAQVGARLAARVDPETGERLQALLADRPLALEEPAPALTALTNRIVAYLEDVARRAHRRAREPSPPARDAEIAFAAPLPPARDAEIAFAAPLTAAPSSPRESDLDQLDLRRPQESRPRRAG